MIPDNFDIEHFPTNPTALRMLSRISPIYDRSYVGKWIFEVMGADMDDVRLRFEELRAQASPETATWGLMYWEQRYGLPVGSGLSDIEARRRKVLGRRRSHAPLNPKRVERILSDLTGREVIVTENVADYTFNVEIRPGDNVIDIEETVRRLKQIKPSHQTFQVFVEQPKVSATLCFGGAAASITTLPIPEAPEGMKWLDMLRTGGAAAILTTVPIPAQT